MARSSIQPVAAASAGPPFGRLYLKPPSWGGLCDGVITMPSASSSVQMPVVSEDGVRQRRRGGVPVIAVDPSPPRRSPPALRARWRRRARTGRACPSPGTADRARRRCFTRYSQMACVIARMCRSLNEQRSERAAVSRSAERHLLRRHARVRPVGVISGDQFGNVHQHFRSRGWPARGWGLGIDATLPPTVSPGEGWPQRWPLTFAGLRAIMLAWEFKSSGTVSRNSIPKESNLICH